MRLRLPSKIKSTAPEAVIINQLIDALRMVSPQATAGALVHSNRRGTAQIPLLKRAKAGSAIIGIKRFRIIEVLGDALTCQELNGNTQAAAVTYIAKPYYLRYTPFHQEEAPTVEEINEGTVTYPWYSYAPNTQERTARFADGSSYTEFIEPVYRDSQGGDTGDEIVAVQVSGGIPNVTLPGQSIEWIDANVDARHWDIPIQAMGVCQGGQARFVYVRRSGVF